MKSQKLLNVTIRSYITRGGEGIPYIFPEWRKSLNDQDVVGSEEQIRYYFESDSRIKW